MQLKEVEELLEPRKDAEEPEPESPSPDPERWKTALKDESSTYKPEYEPYLKQVLPSHLKVKSFSIKQDANNMILFRSLLLRMRVLF